MTDPFGSTRLPAVDLLKQYISEHGIHTLTPDVIASRRYVVARYACPQQLGNRMMDFLNAAGQACLSEGHGPAPHPSSGRGSRRRQRGTNDVPKPDPLPPAL